MWMAVKSRGEGIAECYHQMPAARQCRIGSASTFCPAAAIPLEDLEEEQGVRAAPDDL